MYKTNPIVIPRNHLVEEAIQDATEKNDYSKTLNLIEILKSPYNFLKKSDFFQSEPDLKNDKYVTYCGT